MRRPPTKLERQTSFLAQLTESLDDSITPEMLTRQLSISKLMTSVAQRGHYTAEDAQDIVKISQKRILKTQKSLEDITRMNTRFQTKISFKDFKIVKPIAAGAYGCVYLVQKRSTQQYFAMKAIDAERWIRKEQVKQILAEQEALKVINGHFLVSPIYIF